MMTLDYLRSALPSLGNFSLWQRPTLLTREGSRQGRVDLVGAGPGAPDLITRKGWKALLAADVIVYDALVSDELMQEIPATIRRIYVGKLKGQHSVSQPQICRMLVQLAREGLQIVRLKGGDPLVFGRLTEEMDALRAADIPFSIVPGITAAAGCAASCNLPLTERVTAPRLRLITAHSCDDRPIDWSDLARRDETLVFYMGLSMAETISNELQQHGLPNDWPVLLVERGTHADQRALRTDLAEMSTTIEQHALKSPTLILVGKVVEQYREASETIEQMLAETC
ncbi:hypothetical protein GCM10009104_16800 [Marinobacterium maritimum]|uniref:uroporphyrinogen-III C-methyltransferase n=1 Tax=Marinobacterium maritimum TaxID=500162 RepID=A0ABN1I5Q1_9GAMM